MTEEVKTGMCGLCGMHCRIGLRVRDGELVGVQSPWGKGSAIGTLLAGTITSCPRANAATEYLYHPLRLNFPLKKVGERGENRWQRISWEQALKVRVCPTSSPARAANLWGSRFHLRISHALIFPPGEMRRGNVWESRVAS
jgi:anaerobic selenocysteine-containing dehydrogenase